jgi:hypothetical protein
MARRSPARHNRRVTGCDCPAPARWLCPACPEGRTPFLACSRRCLARHHGAAHGGPDPEPVFARMQRELAQANRCAGDNWNLYAGHRARLASLTAAVQRGDGLCVLGAGNGDDLDLPLLARLFGEVHLVDLDGAALERARARQPPAVRARLRLHPGLDLGGVLADVEDWAEHFPDAAGWRQRIAPVAGALADRIGRRFDVVLSDCLISQLCVPLYRAIAARPPEWAAVMAAVGRLHLGTMRALLRPGGTGVLVGDFPFAPPGSSRPAPGWDQLPAEVAARLASGVLSLRKPDYLATLVQDTPDLDGARRTEPWLWAQADAVSLAYALLFRREEPPPS